MLGTRSPEVRRLVEMVSEKALSYMEVDSLLRELLKANNEYKSIISEVKEKISIKGI